MFDCSICLHANTEQYLFGWRLHVQLGRFWYKYRPWFIQLRGRTVSTHYRIASVAGSQLDIRWNRVTLIVELNNPTDVANGQVAL